MLTTNDAALAREADGAARARQHGASTYHEWVGVNSRLDALQAAVLRVKFRHLDGWTGGRQTKRGALPATDCASSQIPVTAPQRRRAYQTRHIYNQFVHPRARSATGCRRT